MRSVVLVFLEINVFNHIKYETNCMIKYYVITILKT